MKPFTAVSLIMLLLVTGPFCMAQEDTVSRQKEETLIRKVKVKIDEDINKPKKTTGWVVAPLPKLGYSSDKGFIVGVNCQLFNYGDGSAYPNYTDELSIQAEYRSTVAGSASLYYTSYNLIKRHIFTASASYTYDDAYDFRGYNGYNTPMLSTSPYYSFYKNVHQYADLSLELALDITKQFQFVYGLDAYSVKFEGKSRTETLYQHYVDWNIIHDNEKTGGLNIYAKLGLLYDSRDYIKVPSKGIYTYLVCAYTPDIINGFGDHHLKLSFFHTQFLNLYKKRLIFAYRLAYQGTIYGESPFYLQQALVTCRQAKMEGLGGMSTLRGVLMNRVVGRGVALANAELRYTFYGFDLFKWHIDLGINTFFDAGMVVQKYRQMEMDAALEAGAGDWICGDKERPHLSYGLGIKAIVNQTFVLSVEGGIPVDIARDGNYGLSFKMGYVF